MLKNLKLSRKIIVLVGTLILLIGATTAVSYYVAQKFNETSFIIQGKERQLRKMAEYQHFVTQIRLLSLELIADKEDIDEAAVILDIVKDKRDKLRVLEEGLRKLLVDREDLEIGEKVVKGVNELLDMIAVDLKALIISKAEEMEITNMDYLLSDKGDKVNKEIVKLVELSEEAVKRAEGRRESTYKLLYVILGVGLLSLVVGALLGKLVTDSVTRPIFSVLGNLNENSSDMMDLSNDIVGFANEMNSALDNQNEVVDKNVARVHQMTSSLENTNQYAAESYKLTDNVQQRTNEGNKIMADLSSSMTSIQALGEKLKRFQVIIDRITEKTDVINDIVFNTKLLSFNAAVEAERAGEHGRGFAVVAGEVGNLAAMSGNASLEIEEMIEESKKEVKEIIDYATKTTERGLHITKDAIDIFRVIADEVAQINQHIQGIVQASKQQLVVTKETQEMMDQLNAISKKNSEKATNQLSAGQNLLELTNNIIQTRMILRSIVLGLNAKEE